MNILKVETIPVVKGIPKSHIKCSFGNFDFYDNDDLLEYTSRLLLGEKFWLYVEGNPGLGKTHFAVALHRSLVAKKGFEGKDSSIFVEWRKLVLELREAVSNFTVDDEIHGLCEAETLVLDDVSGSMSDFEIKNIEKIVVDRWAADKRLVITSNEPYVDFLGKFSAHEVSRIQNKTVAIRISGMDRRISG